MGDAGRDGGGDVACAEVGSAILSVLEFWRGMRGEMVERYEILYLQAGRTVFSFVVALKDRG